MYGETAEEKFTESPGAPVWPAGVHAGGERRDAAPGGEAERDSSLRRRQLRGWGPHSHASGHRAPIKHFQKISEMVGRQTLLVSAVILHI